MTDRLDLPPLLSACPLVPGADAVARAAEAAAEDGAQAGALYWSYGDGALRFAVVLAPEQPLAAARLVLYLAENAMADALGALLPPEIPVTFGWPDRLMVNGAEAGAFELRAPAADERRVPDWLVVGGVVLMTPTDAELEPGFAAGRTTLAEEGGAGLEATALLERFARYFLNWIHRFEQDGFEPARVLWVGRATAEDASVALALDGGRLEGRLADVNKRGDAIVVVGGRRRKVALAKALAAGGG